MTTRKFDRLITKVTHILKNLISSRGFRDYVEIRTIFINIYKFVLLIFSIAEGKPLKRFETFMCCIINTAINRGVNDIKKLVLNCFTCPSPEEQFTTQFIRV